VLKIAKTKKRLKLNRVFNMIQHAGFGRGNPRNPRTDMSGAVRKERKGWMFNRLSLSDRRYQSTSLQRLDIAEAEKKPPVDPHSFEVLRDGVPRYAKRPPGRRVLWRKGDR